MDPTRHAHTHEHVDNRHLEEPILTVDLERETRALWEQIDEVKAGHTARTLTKQGKLRTVLLAVKGGATIPEHKADGECAIQVLSGRVRLSISGERHDLRAGQLIALERDIRHDVEAFEDSSLLLTVSMLR